MREKDRHGLRVDPGHDEGSQPSVLRAYYGHGIDVFPDYLMPHYWSRGQRRPTSPKITDASKATFILEQEAYRQAWGSRRYFFPDEAG